MRFSILLLPLLLSFTLQAQTPFAPVGAQWTFTKGFAFSGDSALLHIQCTGDTVFQGHNCRVLQTLDPGTCIESYRYLYSAADTVWFWEPTANLFSPLIIIGAVPGQQWNVHISYFGVAEIMSVTVLDTSTIMVSGVPLRQLSVSCSSQGNADLISSGTIVERFGDTGYLFPWMSGVCDVDYIDALRCYEDSSISWLNPQYPQCELSTGVAELNAEHGFTISPSIVQAGQPFRITLRPGGDETHLRILDSSGRVVLDPELHSSGTWSLPLSGIYLVQSLSAGSPIAMQRLVVE